MLSLVNLNPDTGLPVAVGLRGFAARHVSGEILTAAAMDAHNTFEHPDTVRAAAFAGAQLGGGMLELTLPAKSVVVLTLD